jgi:SAM-dependent methyltransferase
VKGLTDNVDWSKRAKKGFLGSSIDPADRRGHKNYYIDFLQKMALEDVLELKGNELVLDFGCGSGRMAHWIAPKVKKVIGLEDTPEMIQLAEKNRKANNVDFMLYDGIHFPALSYLFHIVLSVGVLQYMEGETLKRTVSELAQYLKKDGRLYLIEQASDNAKMKRPKVEEYLQAFKESRLECVKYYPIRSGRWWLLYLIRYGFIPKRGFQRIAVWELMKTRKTKRRISYYTDYLFLVKRP